MFKRTKSAAESGRKRSALQQGIAYLSRREYSRQELSRRLEDAGYEPEAIDSALDRLVSEGWQDDARFAQAVARMRANSGYGPLRIRQELGNHKIGESLTQQAMDPFADRWCEIAAEWVVRRYGSGREFREDLNARRKATDFLLRRGFDHGTMRTALEIAESASAT